jgi:hypothetical protein
LPCCYGNGPLDFFPVSRVEIENVFPMDIGFVVHFGSVVVLVLLLRSVVVLLRLRLGYLVVRSGVYLAVSF